MNTKYIVGIILLLVLIGGGFYYLNQQSAETITLEDTEVLPVEPDGGIGDGAEPLEEPDAQPVSTERGTESVLGESVNGTAIMAYHFGEGEKEVLLVGGVHGSYSPNTSALAEDLMEYFAANPNEIPDDVMVTIIPNLNPDGLSRGGTVGRFNANDVDLNRNFDCEWSATGMWREQEVSGGSAVFSEPEAQALRDYVLKYDPAAAVVWFSAEGKVYPSACGGNPSAASTALANTFASAAGYPTEVEFDAYAITGDMVNWMAKQDIPSISVLLSDHQTTELTKNLAGVEAVLATYGN